MTEQTKAVFSDPKLLREKLGEYLDTTNTAKIERYALAAEKFFAAGGKMIDCQCETENMKRYGGVNIPREEYLQRLKAYCKAAFGG